jgi:hypothetical protein
MHVLGKKLINMKAKFLTIACLFLFFCSCKKDPAIARQTQYTIIPQNNSGITGTMTFIDKGSAQTEVDIEVQHTTGYYYVAHIHEGTPASYHGAVYIFDPMYASGGHLSYQQNIPLLYDSALTYNGTFVFHDSTGNNVLGLCGVGINK